MYATDGKGFTKSKFKRSRKSIRMPAAEAIAYAAKKRAQKNVV